MKQFSNAVEIPEDEVATTHTLGLGADPSENDNKLTAYTLIDQVRIFNRVLTEEEVQILYNEMEGC